MNHLNLGLSINKTFFIIALMFISSCIYEPFGIYENPVNPNPVIPQISNVELNVNQDTLWIYGDQILNYHFKSSNDKQYILGLKIFIDGVVRDSVTSDNGEFSFLQSALSEGEHVMNILLYVKSGTGSIADRLNAEAILLTKEWVLMADYSKKSVTYSVENGYLKLNWDMYKNLDLKSYRIKYSGSTKNNYFVDSTYYGAKRTFNVTVEKTNGDVITWGSLDIDENISKPEFRISDNNTYYFTWPKSPYFNAVKYRYELNNSDDSRSYGYYGFKSGNDTVYLSNLYFSDQFNFSLYTLSKNTNENTNDYMNYPRGYMSQYAGEPAYIKSKTSYTSADTLTSFDASNVYKYFISGVTIYSEPILPASSPGFTVLQLSPLGKYLLGIVYATSSTGQKYFAKNISTGDIYYLDYVYAGYSELNYHLSMHISDNGIGVFQLPNKEFFFDFKNNVEIAYRTLTSPQQNSYGFKISPDGKHMISTIYSENLPIDVFKINASKLEKMYSLESGTTKYQFNPVDANMITAVKDKSLYVIQCEPYALLRKIDFASDEVFMNIDYFNDEVLTINSNQFIIRDFNSGAVMKRISKRPEQYYLYENFILHNHHIIKNNVMLKTN